MLNLQTLKILPFTELLSKGYESTFGNQHPEYINFLKMASSISLENIANGDMLYHNVDHTIMVTSVGQEIIRGKHLFEGGFSAKDGLNYLLALLCHDVGFVKGACKKDDLKNGLFDNGEGSMVKIADTGTCALLQPHHVSRSKLFVHERFDNFSFVDLDLVSNCIERTRFPLPDGEDYQNTEDLPGLARAADLIGQLGDPEYLHKIPALFYEFEELGINEVMNCKSPGELRRGYAHFFWGEVHKYVENGVNLLQVTQEGKEWISRLHSHVFDCEHFILESEAESNS
ncbi:MAG: metal-dependent phosphohydrolase [Opitutae bacterium]|jgi:hypothetical protein|nr:metal-dependent phosphohydrolase [Opitutae bacterium]